MSSSSDGKTNVPSITEAASTSSDQLTDDSAIASSPALGPSIGSESDPMTDSSTLAVAGPSTSSLNHQSTLWKCKSCDSEFPHDLQVCPNCGFDQSKMPTIKLSSLPVCLKCNKKAMSCKDKFCSGCGSKIAKTEVTVPSALPAPLSTKGEEGNEGNKNASQKHSYAAKVIGGPVPSDQSGMSKLMEQSCGGDNAKSSAPTRPNTSDIQEEPSQESMDDESVSDKTVFSSPGASAGNSVESRTNCKGVVNAKSKPQRTSNQKTSGQSSEPNKKVSGNSTINSRSQPSSNPLAGICEDNKNAVEITFKVILPSQFWGYDERSSLHLHFGHPKLGEWKHNIGKFTLLRKTENGQVMLCILNIAVDILKKPIAYKYYVHTLELKNSSDGYEDLQEADTYDAIVNRCLSIPELARQKGGVFQQHDGIILPKQQIATNFLQKILLSNKYTGRLYNYFGTPKPNEAITIPKVSEVKENALLEHLSEKKEDLEKCNLMNIQKMDLEKFVEKTYTVFNQLRNQAIMHGVDPHGHGKMDEWCAVPLDKVFINWLVEISRNLSDIETKSPHDNGHRMCSVLAVLSLLRRVTGVKFNSFLKCEDIIKMLIMLHMKPQQTISKQWTLSELKVLKVFIPDYYYAELSNCLVDVINFVIEERHLRNPQWLFVLPLLHILKKKFISVEKFDEADADYASGWDDKCVKLPKRNLISDYFKNESSGIGDIYGNLRPLTYMDPWLLPQLLHICPIQELDLLFLLVPVDYSAKYLVNMLKDSKSSLKKDQLTVTELSIRCAQVTIWNDDKGKLILMLQVLLYEKLLIILTGRVKSGSDMTKHNDFQITLHEAEKFFVDFINALTSEPYKTSHYVKGFNASISFILHSLAKFKEWCNGKKQHSSDIEKQVVSILSTIEEQLKKKWLKNLSTPSPSCWSLETSITDFISVCDNVAKIPCPDELHKAWQDILQNILHEKVSKIKGVDVLTEVLVVLKRRDKTHPILNTVIFDAVIKRFENKDSNKHLNTLLAKTKQIELVGQILHNKLADIIPHGSESVSIKILLEWDTWPLFISIHKNLDLRDGHKCEKCDLIWAMACSTLDPFFKRCLSGSITLREINMGIKNKDKLLELHSAWHTGSGNEPKLRLQLQESLDCRFEQASTFCKSKTMLTLFCEHLHRFREPIEGLSQLLNDVKKGYEDDEINDLCVIENNFVTLIPFKNYDQILPILKNFELLFKKYDNDFVRYFMKSRLKDLTKTKASINLQNFVDMVWVHFFQRCCELMENIKDRNIQLKEVQEIEKQCVKHDLLEHQLQVLYDGLQECHGCELSKPSWISDAVYQIKSYLSLCSQATAANMVLEIKSKLELSGDFGIVEHVASSVTAKMHDQPLSSVDIKVVEVASFLKEIASSKEKWECIEMFSKCLDIVNWIKKEDDVQNFVKVALFTSAGEGDYCSDKLSNLKIVGSGYGPLINKLQHTSDFESFKMCCEGVWEAMVQTPNLPAIMDDCNKDLDWFKSVKETQASVEVTSIGHMNNILKYGCYFIGSSSSTIYHNLHEVISLSLQNRKIYKKQYNLDELRDLESKLVLITGSKADHRKQVDLFLDILHSLCHIAEVLLNHQQIGNVLFTGWILQVPCTDNSKIINKLQKLAKKMEYELEQWKENIASAREKYYELNYYTTLQLLSLRHSLGMLKDCDKDAMVSPEVLALLQSIHPKVDQSIVIKAVNIAISNKTSIAENSSKSFEFNKKFDASIASEVSVSSHMHTSENVTERTPSATMPKLLQEDLTEQQRATIAYVTSRIGCSENLVLKAFETLPEDKYDDHDYANWCTINAGLDIDDNSEADSEATSENMEINLEEDEFTHSPGIESIENEQSTYYQEVNIVQKHIPKREIVDENHKIVQELNRAGYSIARSIEAVEKTRARNAASAVKYLHDQEENEEDEFLPQQQPSRQDSNSSNQDWIDCNDVTIYVDTEAEQKYLSLEELGNTLKCLSDFLKGDNNGVKRPFPTSSLKEGFPNLIVLSSDMVLKSVLQLYMYMKDIDLPLPSLEEVLLCSSSTTSEEVELLWMRAIHDPGYCRVFCLVNAEKLLSMISDKVINSLLKLTQGQKGYRLVIFYSSDSNRDSHFVSKLRHFRRAFMPQQNIEGYRDYLNKHFSLQARESSISAALVDHENLCVRIVTSQRCAMGKSLYVQRLAENLKFNKKNSSDPVLVTIPLHGPNVSSDILLEFFKEHVHHPSCCIYHIDIASSVLSKTTSVLFSLLILQGISDSQGRVWRCHQDQLYIVETTIPNLKSEEKESSENLTMCLLDILPSISCLSPCSAFESMTTAKSNPSELVMDDNIFKSAPYQRVFQYLRHYTGGANLDTFKFNQTVEGTPQDCLQMILRYCGVKDPSWAEIRHFVKFLDLQLESCENSVFTDPAFVGDVMAGLKGFVVKFMIQMSRDFSTSSLKGEVAIENAEDMPDDTLGIYQISERKKWEQTPHPYIFFNEDRVSITFVGFVVQMCGQRGNLVNPNNQQILEKDIITKQLYEGLKHNKVDFQDNCKLWTKSNMIEKLATVLGVTLPHDPDPSYVLTVDNVIKILAIQMRFRCGIPVVIMGETGCGKTRLIRYMSDLVRQGKDATNMLILKVHGGTTETEILRFLEAAVQTAEKNKEKELDTVVFFDEANTTDALGLIKEIMCDHRIQGKPINKDIKFIAACNPYRKHNDKMIHRLENAGLGFFVKATESHQKIGKIPLRQLVYRVLDLPSSMRPLVYDFGQLNKDTEKDYISQIVEDHINAHSGSAKLGNFTKPIATTLKAAQAYMRMRNDECSFVSLRDVERAMIVFKYFFEKMDIFAPYMNKWACGDHRHIDNEEKDIEMDNYTAPNHVTRALILSISVCYRARLQRREDFDEKIALCFVDPIVLTYGADQFRNEIRWCEETLLDNMEVGQNIAKNAALRENVFMMAICVELRIPLFLVGKPGSSKSLAKAIIYNSMKGRRESRKELLKNFKEVGIFSYQCSQLSTSQSVIEVFKTSEQFQAKQDKNSYVAVVVLDEVGLAEDSPNLPLKALHPLLEDGTEGRKADEKDFSDLIVDQSQRVAFVGISNWALDPAKMNRGVMVTRADPSEDELVFSARGICSNEVKDPVRNELEPYFCQLARAYLRICKLQKREFFGLRDFYSLIKMLYSMCKKAGCRLTWQQMEHAIRRNFGGLESEDWNSFDEFNRFLVMDQDMFNTSQMNEEFCSLMCPDNSRLGLIRSSLINTEKTWHGENRYLLFLTENYAALDILKNPEYLNSSTSISYDIKDDQPFILFGSSFPKDKEYTQVCRNINQIKICMETGRTVILLNLENLYESLYDVLNQYYIYIAENRYVDLGLQTHRVKCRVAKDFRIILIAEKDTVYLKFPTPLINRLEKHFVLTSSILEKWQETVLDTFVKWITDFSKPRMSTFNESDAFIGFQKDTPASVIFYATNLLRRACTAAKELETIPLHRRWLNVLQQSRLSVKQFNAEEADLPLWSESVLHLSKFLLLQTASPDSVFRVKNTPLFEEERSIHNIYFQQQHHDSLQSCMCYCLGEAHSTRGLLIQVTTHSHLLSSCDIDSMSAALDIQGRCFSLQAFDTELDFSNIMSPQFKKSSNSPEDHLVVIQCDSGHLNGDLIACARYRIYDIRAKADKDQTTHVLFIIHLPRQVSSSLVGFQGEPWISVHIDDLNTSEEDVVELQDAIGGAYISDMFIGAIREKICNDDHSCQTRSDMMNDQVLDASIEEVQNVNSISSNQWALATNHALVDTKKNYTEPMEMAIEDIEDVCSDEQNGAISLISCDKQPSAFHEPQVQEISLPPLKEAQAQTEMVKHVRSIGSFTQRQLSNSQNDYPVSKVQYKNPLFKRLHKCIQPAASRLEDFTMKRSTKRVELLVPLIPKDIPNDFDESQFHGILIKHIYTLLQEREDLYGNENWIVEESMSSKNLLLGGTLTNALCRRADKVVVQILAENIAVLDRNCNLNLIDPSNQNTPVSKFWLKMFSNFQIMQFKFTDYVNRDDPLPGTGARKFGSDYECEFPFSWFVYERFHGLWYNAKSEVGSNKLMLRNQLCELVKQTEIGEVLLTVDQYHVEDFYLKYLHDFVRIVHLNVRSKTDHGTRQYELISESLDALLRSDEFCSIDGNITLIDRIASLHVVYQLHKPHVLWFGQLVMHNPGATVELHIEEIRHTSEMILHLCALDKALDRLALKMDKTDDEVNLIPWICDLRISQNIITSIIDMPSKFELRKKIRMKWHILKVLQLFMDHILLNHSSIPRYYLRRLQLLLPCREDEADFTKASTILKIQQHLTIFERDVLKSKRFIEGKEISLFFRNCCRYFMEVISTLCFGQDLVPEAALIQMLMQIIFTNNTTRLLAPPFKAIKTDSKATIRSPLLQLLLDYNSNDVKTYLNEYFKNSCKILTQDNDIYLCLLCIQCLEDALHKSHFSKYLEERASNVHQILENAYCCLCNFESEPNISISYLEAVAGIKFGLHVVAQLLHYQCCQSQMSESISNPVKELFYKAREICTDKVINVFEVSYDKDVVGPGIYLVKLLVREYGLSSLTQISNIYKWIIPESLIPSNQERGFDPFVIYNKSPGYGTIRSDIKDAYIGKQLNQLHEKSKKLSIKDAAMLLMALHETITMDYCNPKVSMNDKVQAAFDGYIEPLKSISSPIHQAACSFLTNDQGGTMAQMRMTPELPLSCKTRCTVVIHATSVILSNSENPILLPFVNMIMNPAALLRSYLPTMVDDPTSEVKKAEVEMGAGHTGQFYTCPNGHPYFVGNCGQPNLESNCLTCQAPIGGFGALKVGNKKSTIGSTQIGHDLGDANSRTHVVGSERHLSPPAVCIVRAIMHSAFLWCLCHHEDSIGDLARIVKPSVQPQFLPEFFWKHLEHDIKQLSVTTGRSEDDAALLIHIVLKEILTKDPPTDGILVNVNSLASEDARQQWERIFYNHYISPILQNIQQYLHDAMDSIAKDDEQEHDQLFYLVHEKVEIKSETLGPHLWIYRQKISLDHLGLTLREETLKKNYPILHEFLQIEPKLRATQYLPHLVKLQQSLFDKFNYRLDRVDAMKQTIKEFLQQQNENKNEYLQWIYSLQKAWDLVGQHLKTHANEFSDPGRMPVKEDIWIPSITMDTPIEYLIPTTTHAGVCTTALVDFLTLTHNNFIEKCHSLVAGAEKSEQMKWLKNEVPITHIHQCHLLDYERQIISVVLSHCHYSLRVGEAHTVKYEYQSLQKHILDKFIHGKPKILSDIPQVVFRTDIHSRTTFAAVREKVNPQERLQSKVQKEIIAELYTPDALRASLDVTDTILGFLSSGGGKPNKTLGSYIEKVLKMQRRSFSTKAKELCQLKHVLSLWETLSVELARLTWLRKQEPFNTVCDEHLVHLTEDQEIALDGCLRVFDLNRLLGALFEFIETSLRYFPQENLYWTLVDVLTQDLYKGLDVPEEFEEHFPGDITVSQAVAAWKHIVNYQEN